MEMPAHAFVYNAAIERVIDGDTLDVRLDCGLHITAAHRLRLLGVNAYESRGPERARGRTATAWVEDWIADRDVSAEAFPFRVLTAKSDVFGRWLCRLWSRVDGEELGPALLAAGHAKEDVWP
jgi:micrococcal nuclease